MMCRCALFATMMVIGCGGRMLPDGGMQDAGPDMSLGSAFKVAYQGQGAITLWHSARSPEAFDTSTLGTFTYDGRFMAVATSSAIAVLNADASIQRSQPQPSQMGTLATFTSPRPDVQRLLVYGFKDDGTAVLGTLELDGTYHELANGRYVSTPRYSPDGKMIVFADKFLNGNRLDDEIVLMNDDGSARTVLVSNGDGSAVSDPSFSFDGKRIAYALDLGIAAIDIVSRQVSVLVPGHLGQVDSQPNFTPNGTSIVFVEVRLSVTSLLSVDVGTKAVTTLVDGIGGGYVPDVKISLASDN